MTDPALLFWMGLTLMGLTGSALFSGVETGCYCVNRIRLIVRSERGTGGRRRRAAALRDELDRPDRLLATLLIGNNIANYLGAIGVSALLSRSGYNDWQIVVINAAILTPMLFVVGETLPKDLFRAEADRLTPFFGPPLRWTRWLLTATLFVPLVQASFRMLARVLRIRDESRITGARARIGALLKEGVRHGVLSESQSTLVDRALAFRGATAEQVMVPWKEVTTASSDWSRQRLDETLRRRAYTHLPVVDRRGRVIGVLRATEAWSKPDADVRSLARAAPRVAPQTSAPEALRAVRAGQVRAALVETDGKPVGLATERDLVGPLIGPIETD